jgi:hydroxyacylglutathione hydrolase
MVIRSLPFYECEKGIYEINEFDCVSVFVIVGEKSALVIDCGTGIGNLKWVIENRITDKFYIVAASHNHGDHIGGAGWFDNVLINKADMDMSDPSIAPTVEFRRSYAKLISDREGKYYPYDLEKDIRPWPKNPAWLPLEDGQEFNLGGRTVTAYHCAGHTAGEMVFIDNLTHTLLCGDACNCNWLLNTSLAKTGKECVKLSLDALKRIESMKNKYTNVYNSHHDFRGFGLPLNPDVMPNLIRNLEKLYSGTAEYIEVKDALSAIGAMKTVSSYKDTIVSCMTGDISKIVR